MRGMLQPQQNSLLAEIIMKYNHFTVKSSLSTATALLIWKLIEARCQYPPVGSTTASLAATGLDNGFQIDTFESTGRVTAHGKHTRVGLYKLEPIFDD